MEQPVLLLLGIIALWVQDLPLLRLLQFFLAWSCRLSKALWIVAHLSPLPPSSPHLVSTANSGKTDSITLSSWHKNTDPEKLCPWPAQVIQLWATNHFTRSGRKPLRRCSMAVWDHWWMSGSPHSLMFVRRRNWWLCIVFRQFEVSFGGLEEMFWPGIWGDWLAYVQIHGTFSSLC